MTILYDGLIYAAQVAGGINRYFANLISRLPEDISPSLSTRQIPDVNWPAHSKLKVFRYRPFRPNRISNRLEQPFFDFVTGKDKYDIFHPTYYNSLVGRDWDSYRCPVVLTVYDMIHERFASTLDPAGIHCEEKRKAIMSAQAVICISESTKQDLMEYYPVPESRITVTYLAAEIDVTQAHGCETVPSRPYFLYIGNRSPYKNFDGLLHALSKVVQINSDVELCIVGSPLTEEECKLVAELNLTRHIKCYGFINDNHLAKLYRCSLAFVYPSFYEGFGIPLLEAMACETVVVASNLSSVPEVVHDAGLLFDPYSRDELVDILLLLVNSQIDRERLIAKGRMRSKEFSWDKTVSQTIEIYHNSIGGKV